jgi:hypothetical protein
VGIGAVALGPVVPNLGLKALQVFPGIPPMAIVTIPRTRWQRCIENLESVYTARPYLRQETDPDPGASSVGLCSDNILQGRAQCAPC